MGTRFQNQIQPRICGVEFFIFIKNQQSLYQLFTYVKNQDIRNFGIDYFSCRKLFFFRDGFSEFKKKPKS